MNRLSLSAALVGLSAPRYTPAGLPVSDAVLQHASTQVECSQQRRVELQLKAVAFGPVAETLRLQALGAALQFDGFLAHTRNGKGVVFHIQDFKPI